MGRGARGFAAFRCDLPRSAGEGLSDLTLALGDVRLTLDPSGAEASGDGGSTDSSAALMEHPDEPRML